MYDKQERIVKEKRTIEATKKGLMGSNGKIGCILKNLGDPIIANSSTSLYDVNYFDSDQKEYDPEDARSAEDLLANLPTMEMWRGDQRIAEPSDVDSGWTQKQNYVSGGHHNLGWIFDGLNRGVHMELKYMEDAQELTVHYKGYQVYKEVSGELMAYAPFDEWESQIERLYKIEEKQKKANNAKEKEELTKEAERQKKNWIQKFRERWGI